MKKRVIELIDRHEIIHKIEPWLNTDGRGDSELNMLRAVIEVLKEAPAIDVRPVVHGHWIERATDEICSVCGMTFTEMPFTYDLGSGEYIRNYCPNCGNPMDEKEEEG